MTQNPGEHSMATRVAGYVLPRAAEAATHFRARYPRLGRMARLAHADPRAIPLAYDRAVIPESGLNVVHYGPDVQEGITKLPLPGLYKAVARTAFTDEGVRAWWSADMERTFPAVVWKLGEAAMIGLPTEDQADGVLTVHSPVLNMLLGGAPDGLDTAPGVYDTATGIVTTSSAWMVRGPVVSLAAVPNDELIF